MQKIAIIGALILGFTPLVIASEQSSIHYTYAVGAAPMIEFAENTAGWGGVVDFELATNNLAPIVRVAGYTTSENFDKINRKTDFALEKEVGITVEPGLRYAFSPFSDSWIVSASMMVDASRRRYRLGTGDDVERSWESLSTHVAGGYRWIWVSRLYVLLGTGPEIPIYDRFEEVHGGNGRSKLFWGAWHLVGMSAVGMVF